MARRKAPEIGLGELEDAILLRGRVLRKRSNFLRSKGEKEGV